MASVEGATGIAGYFLEGYITLLAYIFVIFLEYLIFSLTFKHGEDEENGEYVTLRYFNNGGHLKLKVVFVNLFIVLILIPFTLFPLKKIIGYFLVKTGYYLLPITFLAASLGYLAATKEHIDHKWRPTDTIILTSGVCSFILFVIIILRLGL